MEKLVRKLGAWGPLEGAKMVSDPTALFIPLSPASSFPAHPGPGTCSRISPQWFTQVLVTQSCPTLRDPTNCSPPGYMPMGCSRQEYGSRLPFLSPEDLPDLGIEPGSPTLQADSLPFELQGSLLCTGCSLFIKFLSPHFLPR